MMEQHLQQLAYGRQRKLALAGQIARRMQLACVALGDLVAVEILRTLEQAGTKARLELPSNMRLRQDRASLIFRVAQEVLRNVAAHAEAQSVSVVLRELDGMAVLRIEDDGKGFTAADVAARRAKGHVGTNAIVELAEDAGGSLSIDSQPGKGTRVVLKLPVE